MMVFVLVILFVLRGQLNWNRERSEQSQSDDARLRIHFLLLVPFWGAASPNYSFGSSRPGM
jgi:hypothetical protein